jgi:hypothetical protein
MSDNTSETKIAKATTLGELFEEDLRIPVYQRPYRWEEKHVNKLLEDIDEAFNLSQAPRTPYVLGTVILYRNKQEELEIVDGQQRLVTLSILWKLIEIPGNNNLLSQKFRHAHSREHIAQNRDILKAWCEKRKGSEELKTFIRDKLLFAKVIAPSQEEAFVFFDSQNTRGKPLTDYEKLKAHHLRHITDQEGLGKDCAQNWESLEAKHDLHYLSDQLLARPRHWARRSWGFPNVLNHFSVKSGTENKNSDGSYPLSRYQQPASYGSWSFDGKRLHFLPDHGPGGINSSNIYLKLPFQLTQYVSGGEQFFWFVQKYDALYNELFRGDPPPGTERIRQIIHLFRQHQWSKGVYYTWEVYEAAILFYYDKFGPQLLDEIAMWIEQGLSFLRLRQSVVQRSSINRYIWQDFNPFAIIDKKYLGEGVRNELRKKSLTFFQDPDAVKLNCSKGVRKHYIKALWGPNGLYKEKWPGEPLYFEEFRKMSYHD